MLFCLDKETDVMEVIIAFYNFANTPNKDSVLEKKKLYPLSAGVLKRHFVWFLYWTLHSGQSPWT